MGQQATLPAPFVMQYTPMLDDVLVKGPADYRLRFPPTDDGRVFDIQSAVEIGRREGIEIVALASEEIGRVHVRTPVPNTRLECILLPALKHISYSVLCIN